ncbi:MAG: ATP-binding protein [Bacteroidales bacterium]
MNLVYQNTIYKSGCFTYKVAWLFSFLLLLSVPLLAQDDTEQQDFHQELQQAEKHEQDGEFNEAAFFYNKIASAQWAKDNLTDATTFFLKALEMSEELGNTNAIYVLNTNLGLIHTEQGKSQEALNYFATATKTARQVGRKNDVASSLLNEANAAFELNKNDEALSLLNEASTIAKEQNNTKLLRNAYSLYTKVYEAIGDTEESAKYFELFAALTRKIQNEEIRRKEQEVAEKVSEATTRVREVEAAKEATEQELSLRDLELSQKQLILERAEEETREQKMQIDLLNKERELQQAIISHQEQMRKVYIAVIVLIFLFSSFIFYSYQEKRKANIQLKQKNEEISRQNEEIQEQAEKLRELNQLKDKLFSIISHDLRSPLGSLLTLLNLTQQGYFTKDGFKEVVDELSKNVGYTTELLENLLNWAQSQMQGLKIQPAYFNLHDVANSKFELYKEHASEKGIRIINSIDKEISVFADSAMIELVYRNLIANAIKFSKKGGTVTATAIIDKHHVTAKVSDTGTGIAPENLKKLFGKEIFSTKGTSNEKGTGLGLMLCKDFITLNKGEIWVRSEAGNGSEFFFTIPLTSSDFAENEQIEELHERVNT